MSETTDLAASSTRLNKTIKIKEPFSSIERMSTEIRIDSKMKKKYSLPKPLALLDNFDLS